MQIQCLQSWHLKYRLCCDFVFLWKVQTIQNAVCFIICQSTNASVYKFAITSVKAKPLVTAVFPNLFSSRTICGTHTITTYHLSPGKLNLPNIIRSNVWKTRIDTNATWTKWLWKIVVTILKNNKGSTHSGIYERNPKVETVAVNIYIFVKENRKQAIRVPPWKAFA